MLAAIMLPLIGAMLVLLAAARPNLREFFSIATAVVLCVDLVWLASHVFDGDMPSLVLAEPIPGFSLTLAVEPLGMLFALIAGFLWLVTTIYAIGYMRGHNEQNQTRFYTFFAIAIAAAMGVAFAGDLLMLFVCYELLTFSTYPLVTHVGTPKARAGGRIYLGVLVGTSMSMLLLAIILTALEAGTLSFVSGGIFSDASTTMMLGMLLALFVFGIGKAALMPFHFWLPAAMVAPTPVSALLHAVAVVKAGVFSIMKISIYIFGIERMATLPAAEMLGYVAGFTIVVASLIAFSKDNLKARLAYSTISQLSYVVLGSLLAVQAGVIGGTMHIVMHAFGKITLFFCAGAILIATNKSKVSELDGLGKDMPWTMTAFFIASLSIAGLPPAGGVWSKWLLAQATVETGQWVLLSVLLVSTLLNIGYLLEIPVRGFFKRSIDDHRYNEAPATCLLAIGVAVLMTVLLFFIPDPLYRVASMLVR